jgi:dTDP-4-amino-4,6-dideoxygalactose transaminase
VTELVPGVTLPVTEEAAATILSLPMHPGLTDQEVRTVVDAMWAAVDRHGAQPLASDGSAA